MILDFYRLMLFWRDAGDAEAIAATVVMWLLVNLRSRRQELEAGSKEVGPRTKVYRQLMEGKASSNHGFPAPMCALGQNSFLVT